jgi:hypothetical protein
MAANKRATGKKKVRGKQRDGSGVRDLRANKNTVVTGGVKRKGTTT